MLNGAIYAAHDVRYKRGVSRMSASGDDEMDARMPIYRFVASRRACVVAVRLVGDGSAHEDEVFDARQASL